MKIHDMKHKICMITLLLLLCILSVPVYATDYYVDADVVAATIGDKDSKVVNDGKTPETAFVDFPVNGETPIAEEGDRFLVCPYEKSYRHFIAQNENITIIKDGEGDNPVICTVDMTGSTFCILQQADSLTVEGVDLDCSQCDSQASHFGIRTEGDVKGTFLADCKVIRPAEDKFAKNQTTQKQMTFEFISFASESKTAELSVDSVVFENEKVNDTWLTDRAKEDATILIEGKTLVPTITEVEASR